jgi:hypothetical protein
LIRRGTLEATTLGQLQIFQTPREPAQIASSKRISGVRIVLAVDPQGHRKLEAYATGSLEFRRTRPGLATTVGQLICPSLCRVAKFGDETRETHLLPERKIEIIRSESPCSAIPSGAESET